MTTFEEILSQEGHLIYPLRLMRLRIRSRLRKLLAKLGLLEPLKRVLVRAGLRK